MIKNNKGFSLVEIAIVLVIFGVILSAATSVLTLFVNKGEAERTRSMMESNKSALFSFVATNNQLPTIANFPNNVTYPNDGYNVGFYYYVDPILDKTMAGWELDEDEFAAVNTICGSSYTNTVVRVCNDADCTGFTDVVNVAFVMASGSENKNIQTGMAVAGTTNLVTVHVQGDVATDDNATDLGGTARAERYDDIVDWITLDELKTRAGCEPETFKFLNLSMPALEDGVNYTFDFHIEGGVPFSNSSTNEPEYMWVVRADSGIETSGLTFTAIEADGTENGLNIADNSTDDQRGQFLRLSGNTSALTGQYSFTILVYDQALLADIGATNILNNAYERVFFINAQ